MDLPRLIDDRQLVEALSVEQVKRPLNGDIRMYGEGCLQVQTVHLQAHPPETKMKMMKMMMVGF